MADSVLHDVNDFPTLLARLKDADVAALLATADPAELEKLGEHITTTGELRDLLALAGNDHALVLTFISKIGSTTLQRLAESISTPGELRELLELAEDDDKIITAFIAEAGVDTMLDRVFGLMPTRFKSDSLGTESAVVEWHIDTADGQKIYNLTLAADAVASERGPATKPRITLIMSAPNLLRLCAGTLDGVTAFMSSKIKLTGDMMFGARIPGMFDTSS
ncbi:SCP2 sterol-binding domain-containing protein [Spirillospora sp. CA-294931]|uniref:SCP2 sterol-binding domain-containing protein n=1 Tax=Spirillospora sp. CA-294931 TaxID=3240042 RepID=UPI003D8DE92C